MPTNYQPGMMYTQGAMPGNWQWQVPAATTPTAPKSIFGETQAPQPPVPSVTPPVSPPPNANYRGIFNTAVQNQTPPPPDQWQRSQGQSPSIGNPIYNMWDPKNYASAAQFDQINRYLSGWYVPQQQMAQNAYQWGSEYEEAARRWSAEQAMQQAINQFSMGLQGRQQEMSEWEANQAANQWGQQFDWTKTTDQWTKDLAQQQLAQQLQELRERLLAEQSMANVAAYGRAEKPNARYVRNWG